LLHALARDRGTRRLLLYHGAVQPTLEFGLFLTHRLGVVEPPPALLSSATAADAGRPLVCYAGASTVS
jgi:hypothetical protein